MPAAGNKQCRQELSALADLTGTYIATHKVLLAAALLCLLAFSGADLLPGKMTAASQASLTPAVQVMTLLSFLPAAVPSGWSPGLRSCPAAQT